jgi:hypothetical protein
MRNVLGERGDMPYEARHGVTPAPGGDTCEQILGPRPQDRIATWDYAAAGILISAAIMARDSTTEATLEVAS